MMNTVIEELRLMRISLESGKGPISKPKEIRQNEIMEPSHREETDIRGSIVRRYYKTTIEVACIPVKEKGDDKKQKELAILSKLSECTNILKFYGMANLDGHHNMIVEWTHYGNLMETYEAYDIPWTRKLHIATDICRAITFLQSVEIYHHDLRCENVMLTSNLEPKLANFEYARMAAATTSSITNLVKVVHWLAPEKMNEMKDKSDKYRYDSKCEIFRYSIDFTYIKK
ncbi:kinase-like domain-containing protein [Glomus cerebriforme]|uniref:Kinase-like domain-containing protein n=1 Tax=Glomus cerebriforme TaxID=658196 RepID=A0A397T9U0_9GLOM|nr:kinase-like domain-containing protein [Glomus cerebriforme]